MTEPAAADPLDHLFHPRSIAVVGASGHPADPGCAALALLQRMGFAGAIHPVNPGVAVLQGLRCHARMVEIGAPVDLAIIALPAALAEAALADAADAGVAGALLLGAGDADDDAAWPAATQRLSDIARTRGIRMLGPHALGFLHPRGQVHATCVPLPPGSLVRAGPIGLVSQGGAFGLHADDLARVLDLGLSLWASTGQEGDLQVADIVAWLARDAHTRVILARLVRCRDLPRLHSALDLARAAGKPVVVWTAARADAAAPAVALDGDQAALDALLRQCGALRVHTLDDLCRAGDMLRAAAEAPPPAAPMAAAPAVAATPQQALAQAVGLAAFVYGYPLLESMRTCAVQTGAVPAAGRAAACAPIDQLLHWAGPTQAEDRDVVTPANDLMYSTAWIQLSAGPRWLTVPAAAAHPGRYFVLALYDAHTENFENLGPRNCAPLGERVLLVGPGHTAALPPGVRVLRAPTHLVWLLARVLVVDADDLPAARRLQAQIAIAPLAGTPAAPLPLALQHWQGPALDPMAAVAEQGLAPDGPARHFYTNLCHALADAPGRAEDQGLLAWLATAGLQTGTGFDWAALDVATRAGLVQGFADGVALVAASARHRRARPWVLSWHNGRYGSRYLARAIVAYIGLGALHTGEALYASGHFDADGQLLDGRQACTLRFEPDAMPPAEAFWSVTLYGADRYLYPNPLRRHAIGDRSRGLQRDPDGGLTLRLQHAPPADGANWLPAPAGRYYLILRLYHPRDDARGWRIPPLRRSTA